MVDTSKATPEIKDNYTSSGINSYREDNRIGHEINMLSTSQDLTKSPTGYRYNSGGDANEEYSFQVIEDTTYVHTFDERRVSIRGGLWDVTVDGVTQVSMSISASGDFTGTGSLPTNLATMNSGQIADGATAWVYLLVYGTALGEVAEASRLDAYLTTGARPDEDASGYQATSIKVLAKVVNTGGVLDITQEWRGGNLKTKALVLDGVNPLATTARSSLGYSAEGDAEISLFSHANTKTGMVPSPDADGGDAQDLYWAYGNTVSGNGVAASLSAIAQGLDLTSSRYLSWNNYKYNVVDGHANLLANDGGGGSPPASGSIDLYDAIDEYFIVLSTSHSNLNNLGADDHDQYLKLAGDKTRNSMSGEIGDGSNRTTIAPSSRVLTAISGNDTVDWENRLLDGGDWSVNTGHTLKLDTMSELGGGGLTVAAGTELKIADTTDGATAAGALQCQGGAFFNKKVYINDTTSGAGTGALEVVGGIHLQGLLHADGVGVLSEGYVDAGSYVNAGTEIRVNGTKVVDDQGATVADATDAASAITQLNALLARVRAHGLIAT